MNDEITRPNILIGSDEYTLDRCLADAQGGNLVYPATDSNGRKFMVKRYVTAPRESFERSRHVQRVIEEAGGDFR